MIAALCVLGVRPLLAQAPPASVDLRQRLAEAGLAPRSQGGRDTCSLFAIAALAHYESCDVSGATAPVSEEFLTWAANEATGLRGDQAMFYEALHGLATLGICTEEDMPYERRGSRRRRPGETAIAAARELRDRWQAHWIKRWDLSTPLDGGQMLAIKQALADGHPVACGLRWPAALDGAAIREVPDAEGVFDGHSIVFLGYADDPADAAAEEFLFRNSAGEGWGEEGYGRMAYAYARQYANDALWLQFGPPGWQTPTHRFEAEDLSIAASQRCQAGRQDMGDFGGGMWSGGAQLLCQAGEESFISLEFNVPTAGRYRVRLLATAAPDFGRVRAILDDRPAGDEIDLYSGRVSPSGGIELATLDLTAGAHCLQVTVVGRHPSSGGHAFGLDAIDLLAE
jgi:hypothetical protein